MPAKQIPADVHISEDAGQRITTGSDGGLYVPPVPAFSPGPTLVKIDPEFPSAAEIQSGLYENFVFVSDYGNTEPTIVLPVIDVDTPRLLRFAYAVSPALLPHDGVATIAAGIGNTIVAPGPLQIGQIEARALVASGVTLSHAGGPEWYILSHAPILLPV